MNKNAIDIKKFSVVILLLLFGHLIVFCQQSGHDNKTSYNKFRASIVKVNITPDTPQRLRGYGERISIGVHDSIYHRIVALDDGNKQFFLVSTDAASLSPGQYDNVAEILKQQFGIDQVHFWWSLTHTHSAPEISEPGLIRMFMPERFKMNLDTNYCALVEKRLIEGIKAAREKLSPARLGVGWGFSQANINRRAIDVDGKASLGMNPDGPVDRRIGLLKIDRQDGTPMVCIANYPLHGTVLGKENLEISGDAPGIISDYFEKEIGVPLLFINGAAGNLAPIYSTKPNPRAGHLNQFRVLLGDKIIDAYEKISDTTDEVSLDLGSVVVETPLKFGLDWPSHLNHYTHINNTGLRFVRLPIRFLKINEDIAVWSAPVELFCEISNEIRDRSPFTYTFYFGYTNGSFGYLVTENAYKHKGYEPGVSPFTPQAQGDLTQAVISYLQGKLKNYKSF